MSDEFDVPPAEYIALDLFPALMVGENLPEAQPGGVLDARRLIVTDKNVLVFSDTSEGPALSYTWTLVDMTGRNTIGWTVTTEEGYNFHVRRSNGCGCGSRLRGAFPYPGVPYQTQL